MKKSFLSIAAVAVLATANTASAFWGGNDDWKCYGPYGYIPDCNPYDEWDPRYWMEEMSQVWDDDYYGGGPWGGPWGGGPYGYGAPYGGYGPAPYGAPAPYGYAPAPAPAPAPAK